MTTVARRGRPRKINFTDEDLASSASNVELGAKYGCTGQYVRYARASFNAVPSTEWRHTHATRHCPASGGRKYLQHHVPGHPLAGTRGLVSEQRLVCYDEMGESMRVLGSEVHHRNEDTEDNRTENLIWFETPSGHKGLHAALNGGTATEVEYLATTEHEYRAFCPKLNKAIQKAKT